MSVGVRLTIGNNPGENFDAQLGLIKSTGAGYDGDSRCWWLWLGDDLTAQARALTTLFESARRYGTAVTAEVVRTPGQREAEG